MEVNYDEISFGGSPIIRGGHVEIAGAIPLVNLLRGGSPYATVKYYCHWMIRDRWPTWNSTQDISIFYPVW
jgi:hypothetical protein